MIRVIDIVTICGAVVGLAFFLLCLASGIYFIANFIEENPLKVKKQITKSIAANLVSHVLMLLFEDYPKGILLYSMICQLVYTQLLRKFPMLEPNTPIPILSTIAVLSNHALWFNYFLKRPCSNTEVVSFFVMIIWLTPLCFLLSMSNSTQGLPNFAQVHTKGKNRNVLVALLSSLFSKPVVSSDPSHTSRTCLFMHYLSVFDTACKREACSLMIFDSKTPSQTVDENIKLFADLVTTNGTVDPKQLRTDDGQMYEKQSRTNARRQLYNAIVEVNRISPPKPFVLTTDSRPAISYITLIKSALISVPEKRMKLFDIYKWIMKNYPYYRTARIAWKNSVRHALSASKEFVRISDQPYAIRGGFWTLSDLQEDNLEPEPRYILGQNLGVPQSQPDEFTRQAQIMDEFWNGFKELEPDPFCFVGENSFHNSDTEPELVNGIHPFDMPDIDLEK